MACGKSTLINAIVGENVSKTSASGVACTQVVTSYAFLRDEDETTQDIHADNDFLTGADLKGLGRRHLHSLHCHCANGDVGEDDDGGPDQEEEQCTEQAKEESPTDQAIKWLRDIARLAKAPQNFRYERYYEQRRCLRS
jgi:hypothetical protein